MKQLLASLIVLWIFLPFGWSQLTIKVTSLPKNSAPSMTLYVAGTFNNWAPGDEGSKMTKNKDGAYELTVNPPAGEVRFKITRGSWATVEGNISGAYRPDRILNYDGTKQNIYINVVNWENASNAGKQSTAAENVIILNKSFFMPQLNRSRKIWIYLPPDYYTSDKQYPVLYLHDGQNIFDQATSFSGEWKLDEGLNDHFNKTQQGFIAVAVDNGAQYRFDEYSAWRNLRFGGGEGDQYIEFIAETLKPYIDNNFRTLSDRENTAIIGSSMGGLISHYGIIDRPDVFGKAGVFSPSFWFTDQAFWHVGRNGKKQDVKIYMIGGSTEGSNMVGNMFAMKRTMLANGFDYSEVLIDVHADGKHSEWYWAREIIPAVKWLFSEGQSRSTPQSEKEDYKINLTSSNGGRLYNMKSDGALSKKAKFAVYDGDGLLLVKPKKIKLVSNGNSASGTIKLKKLGDGEHFLHVYDDKTLMVVKKIE